MKNVLAISIIIFAFGILRAEQPLPLILGGVNDGGAIQRQVDAAAKAGQNRVVIAPGVYRLDATGKRAHLFFADLHDLEISAEGVTLIFTTPDKGAFLFYHCRNVSFHGATLLRDPLPFSQGRITGISPDRDTIDVQISAGYPTDVENREHFPPFWLNLFDDEGHWAEDLFPAYKTLEKTGPDTFRVHGMKATARCHIGSRVAWRGRIGADFNLVDCQGMKITGVTTQSSAGWGAYENGGEGGSYFSYTIAFGSPPPGATEKPLLASNGDGFHSSAVRHGPTLENCHFEGMNDDGIAIQGKYSLVEKADGADLILQLTFNEPFGRPGDIVRLYDEKGAFVDEARVVAVTPTNFMPTQPAPKDAHMFRNAAKLFFAKVTLDHPIAAKFGWLVANASENGDGFTIRDCTVRYNRARGMLIKASDGLIENCTLEGSCMGGIVLTPEMSAWEEADYSRNVIIRHNTLIHEDYDDGPGRFQAGALTVAAFEHGRFVPLPGGHRNIIIEDNTFKNNDGANIVVSSAQGVTITGNHFIKPMENPSGRGSALGVDPAALIWVTQSSGVKISNNILSEPGPYFRRLITTTPTASGSGFTNGISSKKE